MGQHVIDLLVDLSPAGQWITTCVGSGWFWSWCRLKWATRLENWGGWDVLQDEHHGLLVSAIDGESVV